MCISQANPMLSMIFIRPASSEEVVHAISDVSFKDLNLIWLLLTCLGVLTFILIPIHFFRTQ